MGAHVHSYPGNSSTFRGPHGVIKTSVYYVITADVVVVYRPPCLFGGILPYFEVTGHPVPVSSLGFQCPNCFIWNRSYIVYPSKMKAPFRDNYLRYYNL